MSYSDKCPKCQCGHQKTLKVSAKCVDACWVEWPNGAKSEGYAPDIPGLGGGDYLELEICLDCGRLVGFPLGAPDAVLAEQPGEPEPVSPKSSACFAPVRAADFVEVCQVCGNPEGDPSASDCPTCWLPAPPEGWTLSGEVYDHPSTGLRVRRHSHLGWGIVLPLGFGGGTHEGFGGPLRAISEAQVKIGRKAANGSI